MYLKNASMLLLLLYWCHLFSSKKKEKEKNRAWKHEKGLQVWEGQMFFRPTERRVRKKRAWRVRKINLESEWAWRGERGRKATSTTTGKPRIPLCFIPVRKLEESVWPLPEPLWHFTQTERANEPTKTSTASPLICRLFLLLLSTKGTWRRKGEKNKKTKKLKWTLFSAQGVRTAFIETVSESRNFFMECLCSGLL